MSNSYDVRLKGVVSTRTLDPLRAGSGIRTDTILYGDIRDQAALHGLLARIRDLGLELVGWLVFSGTILGIAGIMRIFDALSAFRYDGVVPDELEGALLGTSMTTYGWVWLVVGVGLLVSSFAVLTRSQFARWIGIIAGAVLAISATWWMPYYPVWSFTFIIIGVLVVYGLAAHGGRISVD